MENVPRVAVGALVFNSKGDIILLKSPKWHDKYINPCGHLEFMEKIEEGVKREVFEETGLEVYDIKFQKILEFLDSEQFHKRNLHFVGLQYICKAKDGKVRINREASEHTWIKPEKALNLDLEDSTREIIEDFLKVFK